MQRSCVSVAWRVTSGIKAVKETEHHLVNSRIKAWLIDDRTKENWTLILERQSIFESVLHKIAQPRGAKKFHAPEYFHHSLPPPLKKNKKIFVRPLSLQLLHLRRSRMAHGQQAVAYWPGQVFTRVQIREHCTSKLFWKRKQRLQIKKAQWRKCPSHSAQ